MSFAKFKSQAHFKHIEGRPFCHFPGHNEPMLYAAQLQRDEQSGKNTIHLL